jgi:hypothetical protein
VRRVLRGDPLQRIAAEPELARPLRTLVGVLTG